MDVSSAKKRRKKIMGDAEAYLSGVGGASGDEFRGYRLKWDVGKKGVCENDR